jgi:hypothetical protein
MMIFATVDEIALIGAPLDLPAASATKRHSRQRTSRQIRRARLKFS